MNNGKIFIGNELRSMQNSKNNAEDNFTIINSQSANMIVFSKAMREKRVECLRAKGQDKISEKLSDKK